MPHSFYNTNIQYLIIYMNTNTKWIVFIVGLFLLSGIVTIWYFFGRDTEKAKSPEVIAQEQVENFYTDYLLDPKKRARENGHLFNDFLTEDFTGRVDQMISTMENKTFDPIVCSGVLPQSLTFVIKDAQDNSVELLARSTNPAYTFEIEVMQEQNQWKIDNVMCYDVKEDTQPATETMIVQVFFSLNSPTSTDCTIVHARERVISLTDQVARVAIQELLKGPTELEKQQGFFTSINPGVKVNSVVIEDKTATVDFDKTMEDGMGGSCRVTAIQAQISETLKQFPPIEDVIISVEGKTEEVLHP